MIHQILKFSTVILLFAFISTGCQKDDVFELRAGDKNAVIVKEVDGIEFKFCLLNEQGEPATVFNEGENFTFLFSIKNNTKEKVQASPMSLLPFTYTKDFFAVKKRNKYYGKAYLYDFPEDYEPVFPEILSWLGPSKTYIISSPLCENRNDVSLKKGVYYTSFSNTFDFGSVKTDKLTFKINFKIK